jgi:hypothetical protein
MDILTKLEEADIDGYDWDWTAKYLDDFVDDLKKAYITSYLAEFPDSPVGRASPIPLNALQREAAEWALVHGASQIVGIADVTKVAVRKSVSTSVLAGQPIRTIIKSLQEDFMFSRQRATSVARTETALALGQGQKGAAKAQGKDQKRWVSSGDIDDACLLNEQAGWIAIGDVFPSGDDTVPQHPNCRCVVQYRASEKNVVSASADFRCSGCNRLLARNARKGVRIHCRHCKAERIA